MISDEHLKTAISEGVITDEQAARLRAIATRADAPSYAVTFPVADPDDERFRLIGGFNDVFVTIGVALLVSALIALSSALAAGLAFSIIGLLAAWALAEVFSRRMRLALPSIALAIMFAGAGGLTFAALGAAALATAGVATVLHKTLTGILFGVGAALCAALHERRFRVPIDAAIVAASIVGALFAGLALLGPEQFSASRNLFFALSGLAVFLLAVRIDAGDPERLTRRADVAFWLHLLAAPMIVHAVLPRLMGETSALTVAHALAVLTVFALLGLVAVIIDRRALLVSGLLYAGIALAYLLSESPAKDMRTALTLLGLATFVLGLSIGWRPLRAAILPRLPLGRLRRFVPPPSPSPTALPATSLEV
jgi:hypothetical protein